MKLKLYKCTSEDGKTWLTLSNSIDKAGMTLCWDLDYNNYPAGRWSDAVKVEFVKDLMIDLKDLIKIAEHETRKDSEIRDLTDQLQTANDKLRQYRPWHFGLYKKASK